MKIDLARRRLAAGGGLLGAALLLSIAARDLHGLALVVRAADLHGMARHVADLDTVAIEERLVEIPAAGGAMSARVYSPLGRSHQTVMLVSGVHPAGADEPRLKTLARQLAEANVTVVTPEIAELSRFELTPIVTDRIESAAEWLANQRALAPAGRIGLMGVSFSGGLAVVAAGRASIRDRLLFVFSFGGHDDLQRVLEYFCTGRCDETEPPLPPAHDYGVAIVLLNVAEHLVPPDQLEPLRQAVRRFLIASYVERFDRPRATREFAALRTLAGTMPEPAATLLRYVNDRDVTRLGPVLRPPVSAYVNQAALSPTRSPLPRAPVYLLHGKDDTVIPAGESRRMADRLRGVVPVRLLVTGLISHVDPDEPPHVADVVRLAHFWGDLLAR